MLDWGYGEVERICDLLGRSSDQTRFRDLRELVSPGELGFLACSALKIAKGVMVDTLIV